MLKSLTKETFLKRVAKLNYASLSTAAPQQIQNERLATFRTSESDPTAHTSDHLGQYYTLPPEDKQKLFLYGGLTKKFEIQSKTFNETCIMVRKPALDLITCLKTLDYTKPAVRFVVYGKMGAGKSLILAHSLHYGHRNGFLIVHVPWVGNWLRARQELSESETQPNYKEINVAAAAWLYHFRTQNADILTKDATKLCTSQDHVWSKREMTEKGASILTLVDHGINRIKYASRCALALVDELKKLSRDGACKTLVAIDGFNAFFYPNTKVFAEHKKMVGPERITLTQAFLEVTKADWCNAAIVVVLDELAIAEEDHKSHLPRYLLRKEGFEHLDPFVPVFVDNYSKKELTSCLDYYRERKWLFPVSGQDEEIGFLTGSNPYKIMDLCKSL